jgi:hypothetical protein
MKIQDPGFGDSGTAGKKFKKLKVVNEPIINTADSFSSAGAGCGIYTAKRHYGCGGYDPPHHGCGPYPGCGSYPGCGGYTPPDHHGCGGYTPPHHGCDGYHGCGRYYGGCGGYQGCRSYHGCGYIAPPYRGC